MKRLLLQFKLLDRNSLKSDILWLVILTVSLIMGFFIRVNGIGKAPLAVDEYYIVKSVENILKHGLPQFDTGGFYMRGALFQYVLALISLLSNAPVEFSYRFVTILINLLALPPLFMLARKVGGKIPAYIVAILFCFSLWEIEFSRFIRFYAMFQTIFIWYIFLLYIVVVEQKRRYLKWMYLLSFISVFVYEGSIFLIVLNFLPFFIKRENAKVVNVLISICLLIIVYLFNTTDFRHMGSVNYYPADIAINKDSKFPVLFPIILLQTFRTVNMWLVAYIIISFLSGFFIMKLFKADTIEIHIKIGLSIIILLSLLNLFGLAIVLFALMYLFNWLNIKEIKLFKINRLFGFIALNLLFWAAYLFFFQHWHDFFKNTNYAWIQNSVNSQLQLDNINQLGLEFSWKKAIFVLFGYPQIYKTLIVQWFNAVPILSTWLLILIWGYLLLIFIEEKKGKLAEILGPKFILAILLLVADGVAMVNTPKNTTKYSFFFFPLLIIIIVQSMYKWAIYLSRKEISLYVFLAFVSVFVFLVEDYNMHHLIHSGSEEIYLRRNYDNKYLVKHYGTRVDIRTPSEIVNKHKNDNDVIISIAIQADYYLNKSDYYFVDQDDKRFAIFSTEKGTKEMWTNANLLCTEKDLFRVIDSAPTTVWIITKSVDQSENSIEAKIAKRYNDCIYYNDGATMVFRIEKS